MQQLSNENVLTAACYQWFWNNFQEHRYLLFHVPNEGEDRRHIQVVAQLTAMGVIPGMMDFIFLIGEGTGIEMKMPGKWLSKSQEKVHRAWNKAGRATWVIYDLPSFQHLIKYLVTEPPLILPVTTRIEALESASYNFKYV